MIPRIGYYAHHHGSGHLHRARMISEAYPGAVDVLSSADDTCVTVSLPPDVADGPDPGHSDVTAHGRLHFAPLHSPALPERAAAIVDWARRARPALVVVDVSVEVAFLVRLVGVPVVLVRQHGDRRDAAHVLSHELAASLLAPYPAWAEDPAATPEMRVKTTYAGGFSRFDGRRAVTEQRCADEVAVVVGTGGTSLARHDLHTLAAADHRRWTVLGLEGASDPSVGLELLGAVDDPWPHLCRAGAVVVSAGHSALCEAAAAGAPTVAVAEDRPFDEQRHKVAVLESAGAVVSAPSTTDPDAWNDAITRAQQRTAWRRFVDRQGARRTADHLVTLAQALTDGSRSQTQSRERSTPWQQLPAASSTSAAV